MSYGVSNETPWNSDAYDTKNATILPKICISLDPPTYIHQAIDARNLFGSWGRIVGIFILFDERNSLESGMKKEHIFRHEKNWNILIEWITLFERAPSAGRIIQLVTLVVCAAAERRNTEVVKIEDARPSNR